MKTKHPTVKVGTSVVTVKAYLYIDELSMEDAANLYQALDSALLPESRGKMTRRFPLPKEALDLTALQVTHEKKHNSLVQLELPFKYADCTAGECSNVGTAVGAASCVGHRPNPPLYAVG